jgi:hypothetical protein
MSRSSTAEPTPRSALCVAQSATRASRTPAGPGAVWRPAPARRPRIMEAGPPEAPSLAITNDVAAGGVGAQGGLVWIYIYVGPGAGAYAGASAGSSHLGLALVGRRLVRVRLGLVLELRRAYVRTCQKYRHARTGARDRIAVTTAVENGWSRLPAVLVLALVRPRGLW